MTKQIITVKRKKFATGLFWQPVGVGNTPYNYAKLLARKSDKKYNLFAEYRSMVGLTNSYYGGRIGMLSAAAHVVDSLSEFVSFLAVFATDNGFYLVAVRNGIIIRDVLIDDEKIARREYVALSEIPDWGALIAPNSWGMPKSQDKKIEDLIESGNYARLRPVGVFKRVWPSVLFAVLFVMFGFYILKNPVDNKKPSEPQINNELANEYRRQIELKKQEILDRKLSEEIQEQNISYPYDHLPNVMERADLCYKAIAFVMQPIMGWDQTFAKCDEEYVSATFERNFGTLNDFYEIGAGLMPGAIVQQISENEIIVRVKLPKIPTSASLDERDQITVARDVTTVFQQINTPAQINNVSDTIINGGQTEIINVTEISASSKMVPQQFMQAFNDFQGVYMTSVSWRANTRTWNYEVIIYTK